MSERDDLEMVERIGSERIEAVLADPATWAEPPDVITHGILAGIVADRGVGSRASRSRLSAALALGAAAAMTAIMLLVPADAGSGSSSEMVVAVSGTELAPQVTGAVTFAPRVSGWWIKLDLSHLAPADTRHYYEGWVVDRDNWVSIGTFHMRGGEDPVVLWSGVDLNQYSTLYVTIEDEAEGPEPSKDVVIDQILIED